MDLAFILPKLPVGWSPRKAATHLSKGAEGMQKEPLLRYHRYLQAPSFLVHTLGALPTRPPGQAAFPQSPSP